MRAFFVACGLVAALLLAGCSGNDASSAQQSPDSATPSTSSHKGAASSTPSASGKQSKAGKSHKAKDSQKNGTSDTSANDDAAGRDGNIPAKCAIDDKKVQLLLRDWQRVVGSIDRPDHADYTGAFVTRVDHVAKEAKACPGTKDLSTMRATAQKINRQVSADGTAKLAAYGNVVDAGDGWLHKLGFENTELAVG